MQLVRRLFSLSILSDRRLLISSCIVAAGFASSKFFGLLREVLIAREFGTGYEIDAFFAATSFSDLLFSVIAGGALASVFIPVFSRYLVQGQEGREEGWRFASAVVNDVFLLVTCFSVLGMVFATQIADDFLTPGFTPQGRALTADLLRLVLVATILFGVSGTLTGMLHAHNHFVLPAIAPSLYNLGIIFGAIVLAPRWGIRGLAYGVVVGSAAHLLVQVPGLLRHGASWSLTIGRGLGSMRHLLDLMGPRVVTMIVVRVTWVLMTNLASRLGEGSVSALNYAYSLWQFPESLIGTAIALAAFPRLAAHAAAGRVDEMRGMYRVALVSIVGLAAPAALVLVLFARPLVAFLFQRGAFGGASTELVASVLRFYALAIAGESLLELTARVFYAQHDSRTPMVVALGAMVIRGGLMVWWGMWGGAPGLALAYAVGVSLEGCTLYVLSRPRFRAGIAPAVAEGK